MTMEQLADIMIAVGKMTIATKRQAVAQDLARMVGAADLVIFIADPSIDAMIPAPGFPQTLPKALQWHDLIEGAVGGTSAVATLAYPTHEHSTSALAQAISQQGVVVFLGGEPISCNVAILCSCLVTSVALFVSEQRVNNSLAITQLARNSAAQLREQAAAVEEARRAAHNSLIELQKAEVAREQQARELERSNRDLQQFAVLVSHDLQEPLRMVSTHLSIIQARYLDQIPVAARSSLQRAFSGAQRMARLIRSLLGYAQVGVTKRELIPVAMDAVVQEALANLQTRVTETNARIEVSSMPTVRGDSILLIQLVQNLVGNALKYIRTGSIPHIRINADGQVDGPWIISVTDNGIGIEEKDRKRIFEAFQRVHSNSEYEGTGIGLATCRRIVEMHNGSLGVTSTVGVGSTFTFTLAPA